MDQALERTGLSGLRAVMICLFKLIRTNELSCPKQLPLCRTAAAVGLPSDDREFLNSHNIIGVVLHSENIKCGLSGKGLCAICRHSFDVREWLE